MSLLKYIVARCDLAMVKEYITHSRKNTPERLYLELEDPHALKLRKLRARTDNTKQANEFMIRYPHNISRDIISEAIKYGNLDYVRWAIECEGFKLSSYHPLDFSCHHHPLEIAVIYDRLEVLRYLMSHTETSPFSVDHFLLLAYDNDSESIKEYLHGIYWTSGERNEDDFADQIFKDKVKRSGHWGLIKRVVMEGYLPDLSYPYHALGQGHTHIFETLKDPNHRFFSSGIEVLLSYGNEEALDYFYKDGDQLTIDMLERCIDTKQTISIKWLHKHGVPIHDFHSTRMAGLDDVEFLKWVHLNCQENDLEAQMEEASECGAIDNAIYLHNLGVPYPPTLIYEALKRNRTDVVELMLSEGASLDALPFGCAYGMNLETTKWLYQRTGIGYFYLVAKSAIKRKDSERLLWAFEFGNFNQNILDSLMRSVLKTYPNLDTFLHLYKSGLRINNPSKIDLSHLTLHAQAYISVLLGIN